VPETGDSYTFEDVATCLCKGAPPNQKLAQHFRRWARPMEDYPHVPLTPPMTRKEVVALKALDAAAYTILAGLLNSQQMHFVSAQSPASPILTLKGRVKSGPETYPGHGADPRLFCASAILLAWQVVHGKYPGGRNPWATKAAEALFHLVEPKRPPRRKAKEEAAKDRDPLSAWRRPFKEVRKQSPCLAGCITGLLKASAPRSRKMNLARKLAHCNGNMGTQFAPKIEENWSMV
jgi:hypothetical protein